MEFYDWLALCLEISPSIFLQSIERWKDSLLSQDRELH